MMGLPVDFVSKAVIASYMLNAGYTAKQVRRVIWTKREAAKIEIKMQPFFK